MREVEFRGKYERGPTSLHPEGYRWIYGFYIFQHDTHWVKDGNTAHTVEEESIGQYTGLRDATGKKIFEGDILKDGTGIRQVMWDPEYARFTSRPKRKEGPPMYIHVIGNMYDSPELLGQPFTPAPTENTGRKIRA